MIDYTRPATGPDPDGDLTATLAGSSARADAVLRLDVPPRDEDYRVEDLQVLEDWYDSVGRVGAACAASHARADRPVVARLDALESWLRRAHDCLAPFRVLFPRRRDDHGDAAAADDASARELFLDLLAGLDQVHEETDRHRRHLSSRRDGIGPQDARARFSKGRAAHRALAAEALEVLPVGDRRRDQWLLRRALATVRLAEYGDGAGLAAIDEALADADALAEPGSVLDDDQRRFARSIGAAAATLQKTAGDASRATDIEALVLRDLAVRQESEGDPLAAARFGCNLWRAVQLGATVPGLDLRDAADALDEAVRDMDPETAEFPETAAVRALVHTQLLAVEMGSQRRLDEVIRGLDAARAVLPPGHELLVPLLMALAQLLARRADHQGSIGDIRSALALLRRISEEELPDPLSRLYIDTVLASVHLRFHFHTAADDADCTATGDEGASPDLRQGHSARVHQQLRLHLATARKLAAERTDHAPETMALVLESLGHSLMLGATYPDGPGAGPYRGDARLPLVTEARAALREACEHTDPASPHRAGRDMHHLLAATVEAQHGSDPAAVRACVEALGHLADRADVASRPELRTVVRGILAHASATLAPAAGGAGTSRRAEVLRGLEARCAERPGAVDPAAVQLRLHLARAHRTAAPTPVAAEGPLGHLLNLLATPVPATASRPSASDAGRAREVGRSVLRMLASRVLVQEFPGDAVLTAESAGRIAREVAVWCVEDGAYGEAVEVLESGRALALHAEMATVDVADRLAELGRGDLAAQWRRWRATRVDRAPEPEEAAGPWDSYARHPVPEQLGVRVRTVLEEHGVLDGLSAPVPVSDIAAALRATGADELVYLLPADSGPRSAGALRVGSDGRVRWEPMPGLGDTSVLQGYLGALEAWLASPESASARRTWRLALGGLCDWAGAAVTGPLSRAVTSRRRGGPHPVDPTGTPPTGTAPAGPTPAGPTPNRPPHLVLVPLGSLAAVPWAAATTAPAGPSVGGRGRPAVEGLVLSTAPSARMFAVAAARPAARAGDSALLVLGLTGKQARASSSRGLYLLYGGRGRLLIPGGEPDADTRPATVLQEIHRACREHGTVDVAAHLMPDPSESWRSYLAFGRPEGERADGPDPAADRLSAQTIAAQRFPVAPDGPGLCVSLASCVNHLARRHHDESFTMAAAFLAGGASSVLGSLWPVRLHATALVDLLFHHRMREGDTPVRALRAAQLWMADPARNVERAFPAPVHEAAGELLAALRTSGHDPADPALWAGLVAVGR
ncbi:CHAT domain-containing protein [Streptomyces sp. NPDC057939]|uniref:CHAT domain-containing protein n=1 Tax=Streptomyces sp. NPDC057939 TaxID=3346284 RepID=UPI0036EC331F